MGQKRYLMSEVQQRLFATEKISGDNIAYNIPSIFRINGKLNRVKFKKALEKMILRHEILRTHFEIVEGKFFQIVNDKVNIDIEMYILGKNKIKNIIDSFVRPFDLGQAPLLRVGLAIGENEEFLMIDIHHIVFDGSSVSIFMEELSKLYEDISLEPLKIHYKDYSAWLRSQDQTESEEFWLSEYKEPIKEIILPYDFPPSSKQSFCGDIVKRKMGVKLSSNIINFCKQVKATEYMVMMALFSSFIAKHSGVTDVVLGTTVAGRNHVEAENMIGMFVNTLAIRNEVNLSKSFFSYAEQVKRKCIKAFDYSDYPFNELVNKVNNFHSKNNNSLFNIMFTYQNTDSRDKFKFKDVELEPFFYAPTTSKFDLTFNFGFSNNTFDIIWEYKSDLFKKDTMEQYIDYFMEYCFNVLKNPLNTISNINFLNKAEVEKILEFSTNNYIEKKDDRTIISVFNEIVNKYNDSIAIVDNKISLSYRELDEASDKIANILISEGLESEQCVAVQAFKNSNTIIGIIGILKAGCSYLAIDPQNPIDRTKYILKDSGCKVVLVSNEKEFLVDNIKTLNITQMIDNHSQVLLKKRKVKYFDTAYLIYTSGTTGKPKGAIIRHESVIRLVVDANYADFKNLKLLQSGSLAFDASTFEIWGTLLNGGQLYLPEEEQLSNPNDLKQCIKLYKINTMWLTAALFNQMVSIDNTIFNGLKQLLIGGEKLSDYHINLFFKNNKTTTLINGYGPTECTTFALTHRINGSKDVPIPIGRPINQTKAYILRDDELCGIGMLGELCLSGPGLSSGYLNLPELTKKRFVNNPICANEIIYRTGDIVKWRCDGTVDIIGRNDEQIKMRGFRIELDEITNSILAIEGIEEAATVVQEINGEKYICSYMSSNLNLDTEDIRTILKTKLPGYMIPTHIIKLKKLPLTLNGKLDRKSLPSLEIKGNNHIILQAETKMEKDLLDIVREVLKSEDIFLNNDFFAVGGDSIKAISIVSKLRDKGYNIRVKDIINKRILKDITKSLKKITLENKKESEEISEYFKLTPIMKEFFSLNLKEPNYFNQSVLLETSSDVNKDGIKYALQKIVERHDILRATFNKKPYIESMKEHIIPDVAIYKLFNLKTDEEIQNTILSLTKLEQKSLNIIKGPLYHVSVIKTESINYIFITIHHIAIDRVSWSIFLDEFMQFYSAFFNKNKHLYLPKTMRFSQWSNALSKYSNDKEILCSKNYWLKKIQGVKRSYINKIASEEEGEFQFLNKVLSNKVAERLNSLVLSQNLDLRTLFLTSLIRVISQITSNSIVSINLEGHGREEFNETIELDKTIGWFTTIFPFVVENIGKDSYLDLLTVQHELDNIPNNGLSYGLLVSNSKLERANACVTFNYHGNLNITMESSEIFSPSNISFASEISKHNKFGAPLSINMAKIGNKFQAVAAFDTSYFPLEWVKSLLGLFESEINKVASSYEIQINEMLSSDLKGICTHKESYLSKPICKAVNVVGLQEHFLKNFENNLVFFELEKVVYPQDEQFFIEHLVQIIKSQPALRSSFICNENNYKIQEHQLDSNSLPIMIYDDTQASRKLTNLIRKHHKKSFDIENSYRKSKRLNSIALIKQSENKYIIHVIASHAVWDKESEELFTEAIGKTIFTNLNNSEKTFELSTIKTTDISYKYELVKDFIKIKNRYVNYYPLNNKYSVSSCVIPLNKKMLNYYMEHTWNVITTLARTIIFANSNGMDLIMPIPIYVVQNDRRFLPMKDSNSIGCYLDILPLIIWPEQSSIGNSISNQICEMQKEKSLKYINYSHIFTSANEKYDFQQIYSINNQSMFQWDMKKVTQVQNNIQIDRRAKGLEIIFSLCEKGIFIIYPLSHTCNVDLPSILISKSNSIELELEKNKEK
ncbi:non-ribosomal peptide synthetase [Clostridium rectalis]|uniref:non-ribosomal peptide synthetase n=1 Tax=Clostridium rectalis TaxID=2040295 RepID=UPI000F631826|nr:non-ribosomal peptide synthetase [Clostridium rectalis]